MATPQPLRGIPVGWISSLPDLKGGIGENGAEEGKTVPPPLLTGETRQREIFDQYRDGWRT